MEARDTMKFLRTTHQGSFFYSPEKPIIGNNIPLVCSFICHNTPSICNKRSFGFTLVELIITLAVAAILTTIALPSFRNIMANQRQSGFINEFSGILGYTRSEAIKRSAQVGICSSSNQSTCSGSATWTDGWIVWINTDESNTIKDASETLLRVGQKIKGVNLAVSSSISSLIYARSGMLEPVGNTARFKFCDNRGTAYGASVDVDSVGRPSITRPLSGSLTCP